MGKGIPYVDCTWNPVIGCKKVSPGCANCYAARLASTRLRHLPQYRGLTNSAGDWTGEVRLVPDALNRPAKWKKPRRIFTCDMGDLFEARTRHIQEVIRATLRAPQHTYLFCTKRPIDMEAWSRDPSWPQEIIWAGVTIEDQKHHDERVPYFREVNASVRWLSIEPMLEPIKLDLRGIHWVVVGGESGKNARKCSLEWIASIIKQCRAAWVPVFVKQMGDHAFSGETRIKFSRHGSDQVEWPPAFRVREYPNSGGNW